MVRIKSRYSSATPDGNYTFSVSFEAGVTGIEFEPNDTPSTAQGISLGEEITGSISSSGDYDYYSFDLNQSGQLTLSFRADKSSSEGWAYEVYDPTGNLLVGSSCSYDTCRSGEILTAGISSTGMHIVKIKSRYSSAAPDGNYTFSVSFEADVVDARDSVQRLYVAYFNRPADPTSLVSFLDMLPSEPTFEDLLALAERYFSPSREYLALYSGMSNAEIVNTLYQNLFSRDAEPAGLIHWTGRLNDGQETIATIALQLTFSAQGTDAKVIRNKIAVANQFTQSVSTTVANITGYSGNDAAASARNWLRKVDYTDLALETALATLEQAVKDAVAATDRDGDGVPDNRDGEPNDPAQTPPTAVITLSALSGRTPQLVNFSGDKSVAGNTSNSFVSFDWDFGDGNTASGAQVSHTYVDAGVWTVSLSVENDTGLTHTVTEEITIAEFEGPISVSGTISLSGFQFADSDVNDSQSEPVSNNSLNSAQAIPNPSIISGYVNEAGEGPDFDDGGKSKDSGDLFDYFVFNAVGGETLRLLIADTANDLDLALYDENFNLVAYSVAPAGSSDEVVIVPDAPGTYYAEVTPYAGASAYNLTIDTTSVTMSSAPLQTL